MHLEGDVRLAIIHESIHAQGVRIPNLDRRLCLYPIAKLSELVLRCLLPREG